MKKFLSVLLCVVLAGTLLAGCSGGRENAKQTGDGSEAVTIEIVWQQEVTEQLWEMPIQKFNEKYPDVKVKLEVLPSASEVINNRMSTGTAPDIFYTWASDYDFNGMIEEGLVYPVDALLGQNTLEGDIKLGDKLLKSGLSMGEFEGGHYMLPITQFVAAAYHDGKFFADKGVSAEYATVEEFNRMCGDIAAKMNITPMEYAGVYQFMLGDVYILPMIYSADPKAFDAINDNEPDAWKNPAVLDSIKTVQEWVEKGYINKNSLAMDHIQSQIDLINHKCAFVPAGSWLEGEMEDQWPEDFELKPMLSPTASGDNFAMTAVIEAMMLPKNDDTEQKMEYITELLKLFYSNENAAGFLKNTSYLLAFETIPQELKALMPASVSATYNLREEKDAELIVPTMKFKNKEVFNEYQNNINALVSGEVDAEAFCANVQKVADSVR
jgi:N-acetylglucosamine transport system substrate-binding protein